MKVSLHALSESLIESELFGHERGAFSGADEAKIGRFEAADGGTVYLPEISEISEKIQLKLLEFMQYKKISKVGQRTVKDVRLDVRLVLASNRNLEQLLEQGKLREDFYYRIKVINIAIPPLRERRDEIGPLVGYFLETLSARFNKNGLRFSEEAMSAMENYHWRGNIRELKNFMTNVIIRARDNELITVDAFPEMAPSVQRGPTEDVTYHAALQEFQREYFSNLLKRNDGRVNAAAAEAGMTRQGLHNILKKLGIDRNNS
jgi:DNA-binding NtrC family response regulator